MLLLHGLFQALRGRHADGRKRLVRVDCHHEAGRTGLCVYSMCHVFAESGLRDRDLRYVRVDLVLLWYTAITRISSSNLTTSRYGKTFPAWYHTPVTSYHTSALSRYQTRYQTVDVRDLSA
eukprot:1875811-Rhodomonas_salina.2